jgi:hypothetical protein
MDFADEHPSACVIGIDLSPTQPEFVPPNCKFEVDDANENFTFRIEFDFIHCRSLYFIDEKRLFRHSYEALRPSGWLEIKQFAFPIGCDDNTLSKTALARWQDKMMEASKKINSPFDKPYFHQRWMQEAGFDKVEMVIYKLPLNPWAKDSKLKALGRHMRENFLMGIEGFSMALFTDVLGMSRAEVEVFLIDVRKDIENRKIHAYVNLVVVWGQKPQSRSAEEYN